MMGEAVSSQRVRRPRRPGPFDRLIGHGDRRRRTTSGSEPAVDDRAPDPRSRDVPVKQLVNVALSQDETLMRFAFPKEERSALVGSEPAKFQFPPATDMRFNWVEARTAMLEIEEMTELVTDAWTMVVPKGIARDYFNRLGN